MNDREIIIEEKEQLINQEFSFSTSLFYSFTKWIDRGEKTTRAYMINLRQFATWLRYANCDNPTRDDILSYRDWLCTEHKAIKLDSTTAEGWSYRTDGAGAPIVIKCRSNTVVQYLRVVKQFFCWTAANKIYPNIAENIHAPKLDNSSHRRDALTATDVMKIEKSIIVNAQRRNLDAGNAKKDRQGKINRAAEQNKRLYAMYLLAVNAGLRTVEISRANVKDIKIKDGKASIYIWGKGHSEADTKKPIADEVYKAIQDYLQSRSDHYNANSPLFVSTGNRSKGKRMATTTISTQLKRALKDAGYNSDTITAHSLRHTAAMGVLETTGNNIFETQRYLRHGSATTTEHYLHETVQQETRQAMIAQKLYDYYHNNTGGQSEAESINSILLKLRPEQIAQIKQLAQAMAM